MEGNQSYDLITFEIVSNWPENNRRFKQNMSNRSISVPLEENIWNIFALIDARNCKRKMAFLLCTPWTHISPTPELSVNTRTFVGEGLSIRAHREMNHLDNRQGRKCFFKSDVLVGNNRKWACAESQTSQEMTFLQKEVTLNGEYISDSTGPVYVCQHPLMCLPSSAGSQRRESTDLSYSPSSGPEWDSLKNTE